MKTGSAKDSSAKKTWRTGSNALFAGFILAAGAVAWFGSQGGVPGAPDQGEQLTVAAETASAGESLSAPAQPLTGTLPTRLVAEAAGIDTAVTEVGVVQQAGRVAWETAWRSAGHHLTSARPGQPGNMIISGHVSVADSHNVAVFADLDKLKIGDVVEVYSGEEVFRYAVQSTATVQPTAVSVLRSNAQSKLTLITCTPDLKERLVVVGTLI